MTKLLTILQVFFAAIIVVFQLLVARKIINNHLIKMPLLASSKLSFSPTAKLGSSFQRCRIRAWLTGAMTAGGGSESDVEAFLRFFPSHPAEVFHEQSDFAFLWLLNPILVSNRCPKRFSLIAFVLSTQLATEL